MTPCTQSLSQYHYGLKLRGKIIVVLLFALLMQSAAEASSDTGITAGKANTFPATPPNAANAVVAGLKSANAMNLKGCIAANAKYDPANKKQADQYLRVFQQTTEKYREVQMLLPDQAIEVTCAVLPLLRYLEASDRQQITMTTIDKLATLHENLLQAKAAVHQQQLKTTQERDSNKPPKPLLHVERQLQASEKLLTAVKQSDIENTDSQHVAEALQHSVQAVDKAIASHPLRSSIATNGKLPLSVRTATVPNMLLSNASDYANIARLVHEQQQILHTKSIAFVGVGLTPYLKSPLVKTALLDMPMIGGGLNMLEALTGNDWFNNKPLDPGQRLVAFMSILPGSPIATSIMQNTGSNLSDVLKMAHLCDEIGRPRVAYSGFGVKVGTPALNSLGDKQGFWDTQTLKIMRQTAISADQMRKNVPHIPATLFNAYANTTTTYTGLRKKLMGIPRW